jgi:F-box protein 11
VGEHEGIPFAVLQYLGGGSLRDRQLGTGNVIQPLSPANLSAWLPEMAEALDFMHSRGFLHRDVKPSNILFDSAGHPYLADFGVIKTLAAESPQTQPKHRTEPGTVLGTLPYMAAEALSGGRCDGRADQFSLAVTVYEVLTAHFPFAGHTIADLLEKQRTTRPRPGHELVAGISPGISQALVRALAREPGERFPSCKLMARAILEVVRAPATSARPITPVTGRVPVAAATARAARPVWSALSQPAVHLPCPLCQEMVELVPADAGQQVRCASCQADLLASADLRQLSAAAAADRNLSLGSALSTTGEQTPAPQFEYIPPNEGGLGPPTFTVSRDSTGAQRIFPPGKLTIHEPGQDPGQMSLPFSNSLAAPPPDLWGRPWETPTRRRGFRTFLFVGILLFLLGFGGYYAWRKFGKTNRWIVDQKGGGDYTTVTEALADAPANTTIRIRPGHYRESLVLDTPVHLVGDGPVEQIILDGSGKPCLQVKVKTGLVRGLSLRSKANGDSKEATLDIGQGTLVVEDCDISSEGSAAVLISGPQTRPVFRKCTVHDAQGPGMRIDNDAAGSYSDCTFKGNGGPGLEVGGGAAPQVHECTLQNGKGAGLLVHSNAQGTFEDCMVSGNAGPGVLIRVAGTAPMLRKCTIAAGRNGGLVIANSGAGTIEECTINSNTGPGVEIGEGGTTILRQCVIHSGKAEGVLLSRTGAARLEECQIYRNAGPGVKLLNGAEATLQGCKIFDGRQAGVIIARDGKGTFQNCSISGNALSGIDIREESTPLLQRCKIFGNREHGVHIHTEGKGTLDRCDIFGNKKAGLRIAQGGAPLVHNKCKIHDNGRGGVWFATGGKGKLTGCSIYTNGLPGIEISAAAPVAVEKCEIYDNKEGGIVVEKNGSGTVSECQIHDNSKASVIAQESGKVLVKKCSLYNSKQCGVLVLLHGAGSLFDCKIFENKWCGVEVREKGHVFLMRCDLNRNKERGIRCHQEGSAKLFGCDLTNNVEGPMDVDYKTSQLKLEGKKNKF